MASKRHFYDVKILTIHSTDNREKKNIDRFEIIGHRLSAKETENKKKEYREKHNLGANQTILIVLDFSK